MSEDSDGRPPPLIKRRAFLSSAALPVAAALAPPALLAQERRRSRVGRARADSRRESSAPAASSARCTFRGCAGCRASRSSPSRTGRSNRAGEPRRSSAFLARTRIGKQLLAADGIDAVLIGTWPYMHRNVTLAALESGRHVLCQARMANDAAEAREMLAASQRHPDLVCQLVPSSGSYKIDRALQEPARRTARVGEVLSVEVQMLQRGFADFAGEFDWRHDSEVQRHQRAERGRHLRIGDALARSRQLACWPRRASRYPTRRDEEGVERAATIPDHVEVLYELGNGAPVHMKFSETTGLSRGNDIWIFGSEGTIRVDNEQNIFVGRRGDQELAPHPNPPAEQAHHRVEEEFVNAIRGLEPVTMNTFEIGVQIHGVDRGDLSQRGVGLSASVSTVRPMADST